MSLPEANTAWRRPELAAVTARVAESTCGGRATSTSSLAFLYGAEGAHQPVWNQGPHQGRLRGLPRPHTDRDRTSAEAVITPDPRRDRRSCRRPNCSPSSSSSSTPAKSKEVQARADLIFNTPRFHSSLVEAGESCSALSGSFQRIVWDPTIADNAWIASWTPTAPSHPEFRWGRLVAVTFWSELDGGDGQEVWRHLERHEPGYIVHAVYKGTATSLGRMMALTDHPATRDIAVDGADEGSGAYVETGVKDLTAAYVPNVTPNPEWRHDPKLRPRSRRHVDRCSPPSTSWTASTRR
ncbi:hypothetical protein GS489_08150 [Rhodococcus hoagii]|nr:hypothetical protein [Prescottella equi]